MTEVGISGRDFTINGKPTYENRTFEGKRIEGLLFNVRAVQATFDDANAETRKFWAYPDTDEWDPDRNVSDFCAALPAWRAHGVLGLTINFQGGGSLYSEEIYTTYDNNGFTPAGDVKPAYAERIDRVLAKADELGMVVIAGLFYAAHILKLENEPALWRAADQALRFLEGTGRRNILIEVCNETEVCWNKTGLALFAPENCHELVARLKESHPEFLISLSQGGMNAARNHALPSPALLQADDYVLLHGNGNRAHGLEAGLRQVLAMPELEANPKPVVINEDSTGIPNLDVAWRNGVSWGYFDQGFGGDRAWGGDAYCKYKSKPRETSCEALSGFQTVPVNWTINTDQKRAFFARVSQVTGVAPGKA